MVDMKRIVARFQQSKKSKAEKILVAGVDKKLLFWLVVKEPLVENKF